MLVNIFIAFLLFFFSYVWWDQRRIKAEQSEDRKRFFRTTLREYNLAKKNGEDVSMLRNQLKELFAEAREKARLKKQVSENIAPEKYRAPKTSYWNYFQHAHRGMHIAGDEMSYRYQVYITANQRLHGY